LQVLEARLQSEVQELFALVERADAHELPDGLVVPMEIAFREARLARLAEAKTVLEARARERDERAHAAFAAKLRAREEKAAATGGRPGGKPPTPPHLGPQPTDQYNFTDPESRIMKQSATGSFDQDDHAQVAVDQACLLIVGESLSNHPTDHAEAEPMLAAIPPELGTPEAAVLDTGCFGPATFAALPAAPVPGASATIHMAYKLKTTLGKAIYSARKRTVEPVIGIIKAVTGFRQFSLRGLTAAAGEWSLVCLAFNVKRLHTLTRASLRP